MFLIVIFLFFVVFIGFGTPLINQTVAIEISAEIERISPTRDSALRAYIEARVIDSSGSHRSAVTRNYEIKMTGSERLK